MATKDTAPKILSITARIQYERFINGTSSDRGKGFIWLVDSVARDIDHSLDQMNGKLAPTHESRRKEMMENRDSYITAEEWATLEKFQSKNTSRYHEPEELLWQYVTGNDLDGMNEAMAKYREYSHERQDEARKICREVLSSVKVASTAEQVEAALTRLREYHISLMAEADTLKELIASS